MEFLRASVSPSPRKATILSSLASVNSGNKDKVVPYLPGLESAST